eukprot:jgi/Psemu1/19922/gm1.19922_g
MVAPKIDMNKNLYKQYGEHHYKGEEKQKLLLLGKDNVQHFYTSMDKATPKKRGCHRSEVLPVLGIIFVMAPVLSKSQPAPTNGGCKNGTTSNYTKAEVMNMINCVRKVLPIGPDQQEHIAQLHPENYPHSEMDKLHQKSIPTADPNIPDNIALTKEINDGEEEFDLEQGYTVNEDTNCNNNNYTPIWERSNGNDAIPPLGQPFQLTASSSVEFPTLIGESVIAEAPFSLSSATSKKAKKKRSYKRKATSDDVLTVFHLSFEQQERNAMRARQEQQETMNSILSLARAYFSSRNNNNNNNNNISGNNSNAKCTHYESNNPMVE